MGRTRAPFVYRLLLGLHPRDFRERAGAELERMAAELMADAEAGGLPARVRAYARLLADGLATLPRNWLDRWTGRRGRSRAHHDGNGVMSEQIFNELRFALRRLLRSPGYTVASVGTLAVGMGAAAAIAAVVDAVLLQPLPYADPDHLVVITASRRGDEISVAYPDLLDWRARSRTLPQIAGFAGSTRNLTGSGPATRVRGQVVTSNLFDVLGVAPLLGRPFRTEEDAVGAAPVVIVSHSLWQAWFGGDPAVVGRTITLNDEPFTVIGVMPPGFAFPAGIVYGESQLWLPASVQATAWDSRDSHPGIVAVARVSEGATLSAVRRDLEDIAAQLALEHPATNGDESVIVVPALDALVGSVRGVLLLLLGAVAFLLLIACANVANLTLVRAASRRRERAVCAALGAGRWRVAGSALAEALIVCVAGAAAGLLLARALLDAGAFLLSDLPRPGTISVDARVALSTLSATLLTAVVFSLLPGIQQKRIERELRRDSTGTRVSGSRLRGAFVVAQVALAVALLIGAGVLVRSFVRVQSADGGIHAADVYTFTVRLPSTRYDDAAVARFFAQLMTDLEALPGIQRAGAISTLPFSGSGSQSEFLAVGASTETGVRTDVNGVTPHYFAAMGVTLVRGRLFDQRDRSGAPWAVVVDERFAERLWPGQDPIGRRVRGWGIDDGEVIGVVNHVKNYGVMAPSREELYVAQAQRPYSTMNVVVRTVADLTVMAPAIRALMGRLDPDLPVDDVRPMQAVVDRTVASPRLAAVLAGAFAVLAVLLAAIGVYGVIAYGVRTRTQEIGTRVALGASPTHILRMIVGQALVLAGLGVAIGWTAALFLARLLQSLVFDVSARDGLSFFVLPPLLLAIAAVAALLPAWRATRISPLEALREA